MWHVIIEEWVCYMYLQLLERLKKFLLNFGTKEGPHTTFPQTILFWIKKHNFPKTCEHDAELKCNEHVDCWIDDNPYQVGYCSLADIVVVSNVDLERRAGKNKPIHECVLSFPRFPKVNGQLVEFSQSPEQNGEVCQTGTSHKGHEYSPSSLKLDSTVDTEYNCGAHCDLVPRQEYVTEAKFENVVLSLQAAIHFHKGLRLPKFSIRHTLGIHRLRVSMGFSRLINDPNHRYMAVKRMITSSAEQERVLGRHRCRAGVHRREAVPRSLSRCGYVPA